MLLWFRFPTDTDVLGGFNFNPNLTFFSRFSLVFSQNHLVRLAIAWPLGSTDPTNIEQNQQIVHLGFVSARLYSKFASLRIIEAHWHWAFGNLRESQIFLKISLRYYLKSVSKKQDVLGS